MTRFVVLMQKADGDMIGRPIFHTAESVTKALQYVGTPRDHRIHSAMVLPLSGEPGRRVPIHHRAPKWAPSDEWGDVK